MIRFLLYFVAILILLNALVLLWPDKVNYAPHVYAAKNDVNPHFVRLNKEIEARFYGRPVETISDDIEAEVAESQEPDIESGSIEGDVPQPALNSEAAVNDCYRVGPFMHQANYELAQAVLFNADVDYKKLKRASKASNVFRIYLGPFQAQAEVDAARSELRESNVLDHFVRKQDDNSLMISLGIYSTPETASAALRLFKNKLGQVKQRSENVILPDSYWLHFGIGEDERMLRQLSIIDWGEPSAKMGLFSCGV